LISLQKTDLPKIRKSYAEYLAEEFWKENIKVFSKGSGSTTIEFEGSTFANNQNIKAYQDAASELLNLLRFKRSNYKWFKYDDEYTFYTLKTKADSELF
jgi:hypothetical protein